MMIKGSIQEEDITIINIYAPNTGAPQYVRQMLTSMKGEINNNTIVGDFNTPLTLMVRSTKQKIIKETQALNDTMEQLDLINIYWTLHPQKMNFTFFASEDRTFSRTDHILNHKSSIRKFQKKKKTIPRIFSDHNALILDVNCRTKTIKNTNIWRLNNMLLKNQQIMEEINKEIKICTETNENENTTPKPMVLCEAVLRGRFIAIQAYLKNQERSQINNLTVHLKQFEKEEVMNPQVSRRKEILKIRAEINTKETK